MGGCVKMTDKSIKEQYQEKAQEVLERPSKMKDENLSDKEQIIRNPIYWASKEREKFWEKRIKEFIQKEEDLIENDFMMRIIARVSAGVTDLDLIRDLIKQDFKYLKAERFKLAGDALIHSPEEKSKGKSLFSTKSSGTHSLQKPILETMAERGRPSKGSHHGTDAKDVGSGGTHGHKEKFPFHGNHNPSIHEPKLAMSLPLFCANHPFRNEELVKIYGKKMDKFHKLITEEIAKNITTDNQGCQKCGKPKSEHYEKSLLCDLYFPAQVFEPITDKTDNAKPIWCRIDSHGEKHEKYCCYCGDGEPYWQEGDANWEMHSLCKKCSKKYGITGNQNYTNQRKSK